VKIIVIGGGLSGCLTALHYQHYAPGVEIELYDDPNISAQTVGQASFTELPDLLWEAFGFDWHDNPIKATPKTGILYEGWGKGGEYFHPFPLGQLAMHYDTELVRKFILESGKFTVRNEAVKDYNLDADFIFDCRGFPTDYSDYSELSNPINSVILGNRFEVDPAQLWTRATATPDGWAFTIPLADYTSVGYLYNSDITDRAEAEQNFSDLFEPDDIYSEFSFRNYVVNEPIIDKRIILNGLRLFFLEPLESTAIALQQRWVRKTFDWIVLRSAAPEDIQAAILAEIRDVENFILAHYLSGSKYDTPFWDFAEKFDMAQALKDEIADAKDAQPEHLRREKKKIYGVHHPFSLRNMAEGLLRE
jgi:hypothetical protein